MQRFFLLGMLISLTLSETSAQQHVHINDVSPGDFKNVQSLLLAEDSLSSTFIIWVKNVVAEHYHAEHTESILVLEGEGQMTLGDSTFTIRPGDFIFEPRGTKHSVNVSQPHLLKVLSVQSPRFDGTDRITTKSGSY